MGYLVTVSSHPTKYVAAMPTFPLSAQSLQSLEIDDPALYVLVAKRAELDVHRRALLEQLAVLDRKLATLDGAMQLLMPLGSE